MSFCPGKASSKLPSWHYIWSGIDCLRSSKEALERLALSIQQVSDTASLAMSFLRSSSSLRLSRACSRVQPPRSAATTRCLSQTPRRRGGEPDPKAIPKDQASIVEVDHEPESAVDTYHPEHQPDYTAMVDHGTSTFSPVPKRVMNGSEPGEITPAAVLSGAPVDLQARTVR